MPKQNNTSMTPISNDPRDILGQPNIYKNITQPIKRNIPQSNPEIRYAGIQLVDNPPIIPVESKPEIQESEPSQINGKYLASLLGQGVAMVGAGIAGRDPMRVAETFNDMRLYQQRSDERQKQIDQAKKLMDPKSQESQRKRNLYNKVLGLPIPEDVSASDLEDPVVLNSLKQQSIQAQMAKMPKQLGVAQAKVEKQKERKLSQDERALLNNSALAYKALFDMEKAIKEGKSRSSILGDNEYTYAANRFVEGIGRMQSGGAIGPDEVENFKKLIPGRFDSDELSKQKIKDMKAELEARLKSINFDPKEILQSRTPSIDFKSEE